MLGEHRTFSEKRLLELGMPKEEARRFIAFIGMSEMLAFYLEYKETTGHARPSLNTGEMLVYATRRSLLKDIAARALALTPSPNQVNPALQEKVSQLSSSIIQLQSLSAEYEDSIAALLTQLSKQQVALENMEAAFTMVEKFKGEA